MKGCILPFSNKVNLGLVKNYQGITLTSIAIKIYNALGLMNRVFTNGLGDQGSIPGQVIPKTQKNGT